MVHNLGRGGAGAFALAFVLAVLPGCDGQAAEERPVPRFVSLRSDEVNLRAGPGTDYPVDWVLTRRAWPVEVIAEYDQWRRIRDVDGSVGWVHQAMLSGDRTVIVIDGVQVLRAEPDEDAAPRLRAEAGVVGSLITCRTEWCQVEIADVKAWAPRAHLFGILPDETFE